MEFPCAICGQDTGAAWTKLRDGSILCELCISKARLRTMMDLDDMDLEDVKKRIAKQTKIAEADPSKSFLLLPQLVQPYLEMFERERKFIIQDRVRGGVFKSRPNKFTVTFDSLQSFELIEDGVTLLAGARGKEVKQLQGYADRESKVCESLKLVIHTTDEAQPEVVVTFVGEKMKKRAEPYRAGRTNGARLVEVLQKICDTYPIGA